MRACVLTFWPTALFLLAFGCDDGDDTPPIDAGPDNCPEGALLWPTSAAGAVAGGTRTLSLELEYDYCSPTTIYLASSDPAVATVPALVTFPADETRAEITITAVAVGTATITASWGAAAPDISGVLSFSVVDGALPACSGSASGDLAPGGEVAVASGTLAGAAAALPEGASRDNMYNIDPFALTIGCAADQVPSGFAALGPAVTFGPVYKRFTREIPLTLPMQLALIPERATRAHVEVSYTGPGVESSRIVPIASPSFIGNAETGAMIFSVPRLGTYQAVVRSDAPTTRSREFLFRGFTGFSMGAGGAAQIGFRNPELFDLIAPLGGPVDWASLLHYIDTYQLGGFCTEDERTSDPDGCSDGASSARTPPPTDLFEVAQNWEHLLFDEEVAGVNPIFDRRQYMRLYRDLTKMNGNLHTVHSSNPADPDITPPGVPDSDRQRSSSARCATPVVIPPYDGTTATGFFDDEYNPDGAYPVIAFCDGAEEQTSEGTDYGVWDPWGVNNFPVEVAVAVDIDGDGQRGPGEPVIRAGFEPWDDCGTDRLCDENEAGYDAETHPDPAGDDYDYQYNPMGTEGNARREGDPCDSADGEAFLDSGLDGVLGTAQLDDGGFDYGEDNGCFDLSRGRARVLDRDPRRQVLALDLARLRDIDVFADGGIRDQFQFAVIASHFLGGFAARGLPTRFYNGHASLQLSGLTSDEDYDFTLVRWNELGKYAMLRYGDPDATAAMLADGDGGHVGTVVQVLNRLLAAVAWMSARWPDGDYARVQDTLCNEDSGCAHPNQIVFDFTSPTTGRSGQTTVILPPGYFDEENADLRYPVVYFGHGFGQQPADLIEIGFLIWNNMISGQIQAAHRVQKMIFVFPDGRCRSTECLVGTFYTDAPDSTPGGAAMETFMLDLVDYIDASYRTKPAASFEVTE